MGFIQIMDFTTSRLDGLEALEKEWMAATEGQRTIIREVRCVDRDQPGRYVSIIEFDSYETAMANSNLPATQALAPKFAELCDGPIKFANLDVVGSLRALRSVALGPMGRVSGRIRSEPAQGCDMALATADPRAVLGLSDDATICDAKRAFRRLAKHTHPDAGGEPAAFVAVVDAFSSLRRVLPVPRRPSPYDWALRPAPALGGAPRAVGPQTAPRPDFAAVLSRHRAGYARPAAG